MRVRPRQRIDPGGEHLEPGLRERVGIVAGDLDGVGRVVLVSQDEDVAGEPAGRVRVVDGELGGEADPVGHIGLEQGLHLLADPGAGGLECTDLCGFAGEEVLDEALAVTDGEQ